MATDFTHPTLIGPAVTRAVHAREEHVLGIFIFVLGADNEIFILLVG